ncbi:hypothetical protein H4R34_003515 [Dimargaris verticillata]|uniref:Uncharacterized protein n=1 Tax=Dimargaris verticillata TaxID=2761393 RepID=A0A9W8AZW3_9FUNG|nr:hypothetical protein H4R34_003515 [Dimargaris verticillata]
MGNPIRITWTGPALTKLPAPPTDDSKRQAQNQTRIDHFRQALQADPDEDHLWSLYKRLRLSQARKLLTNADFRRFISRLWTTATTKRHNLLLRPLAQSERGTKVRDFPLMRNPTRQRLYELGRDWISLRLPPVSHWGPSYVAAQPSPPLDSDTVAWPSADDMDQLVEIFARIGYPHRSAQLIRAMAEHSIPVTTTAVNWLLSSYQRRGQWQTLRSTITQMPMWNVLPNSRSYRLAVHALLKSHHYYDAWLYIERLCVQSRSTQPIIHRLIHALKDPRYQTDLQRLCRHLILEMPDLHESLQKSLLEALWALPRALAVENAVALVAAYARHTLVLDPQVLAMAAKLCLFHQEPRAVLWLDAEFHRYDPNTSAVFLVLLIQAHTLLGARPLAAQTYLRFVASRRPKDKLGLMSHRVLKWLTRLNHPDWVAHYCQYLAKHEQLTTYLVNKVLAWGLATANYSLLPVILEAQAAACLPWFAVTYRLVWQYYMQVGNKRQAKALAQAYQAQASTRRWPSWPINSQPRWYMHARRNTQRAAYLYS